MNTTIAGWSSPFYLILLSSYALNIGVVTQSESVYPLNPFYLQYALSYSKRTLLILPMQFLEHKSFLSLESSGSNYILLTAAGGIALII